MTCEQDQPNKKKIIRMALKKIYTLTYTCILGGG